MIKMSVQCSFSQLHIVMADTKNDANRMNGISSCARKQ